MIPNNVTELTPQQSEDWSRAHEYDAVVCAIDLGEGERVAVVEFYGDRGDRYQAVHEWYEDEAQTRKTVGNVGTRCDTIGEAMADAGRLFEFTTGGRY